MHWLLVTLRATPCLPVTLANRQEGGKSRGVSLSLVDIKSYYYPLFLQKRFLKLTDFEIARWQAHIHDGEMGFYSYNTFDS